MTASRTVYLRGVAYLQSGPIFVYLSDSFVYPASVANFHSDSDSDLYEYELSKSSTVG